MCLRTEPYRIALIGYGHIGRPLHDSLARDEQSFAVAGVLVRDGARSSHVPAELRLHDVGQLCESKPDLVVEAAHPDVTRCWGEAILEFADYLPLSRSALTDEGRLERLAAVAKAHGHRLLIPHGAVVGADSLFESQHLWDDVEIEFRKHPRNIVLGPGDAQSVGPRQPVVLFEGTVRKIAARYPLNVNAMVACALLTTGLDHCRARLVADPTTNLAHLRIIARGRDGAVLDLRRDQPAVGVSGTEMAASVLQSVVRASAVRRSIDFV
jgi:aspartate dehydrogenase